MRVRGGAWRAALLLVLAFSVVLPARLGLTPVPEQAEAAGRTLPVPVAVRAATAEVRPGRTTTVETTAVYDGARRPFLLHVPDGLLGPVPVVLALHAFTADADRMRRETGLEALADREGFVVAFGEGIEGSWNAGGCCAGARDRDLDDVGYLDAVLAAVRKQVLVDPDRVALTGFSNGAMMALRYACLRSSVVSAVAVVAGDVVAPCAPDHRVDVLDLHGTADRTIPLQGARNRRLGAVFPPVRRALAPFAAAGGEVEVRPVPGAGHVWMTAAANGMDATTVVWDWLRDHPRPLVSSAR